MVITTSMCCVVDGIVIALDIVANYFLSVF